MNLSLAPVAAQIQLNTHVAPGSEIAERVRLDLTGANAPVEASRRSYDPYWDGPIAQPSQPGDFSVKTTANAKPALAAAASAVRDAIVGIDLLHAAPFDSSKNVDSYAMIHLTFAERPTGLDHLRPFQDVDGRWTIGLNTSTDDLLADPSLASVVNAARSVLAAVPRA